MKPTPLKIVPVTVAVLLAAGSIAFLSKRFRPVVETEPEPMNDMAHEMAKIDKGLESAKPPVLAEYDWESAERHFKIIGESMLAYRKAQGSKPIDQRTNHKDAGLPDDLFAALTEPGKPWSIGRRPFLSAYSRDPKREMRILRAPVGINEMVQLYPLAANSKNLWKEHGEKFEVLHDRNAIPMKPGETYAMVLYLDGTVEKVRSENPHTDTKSGVVKPPGY